MGKLTPIKLPPGMFRNGTDYETAGRWFDGNLVRWENGRLKPIGGWEAAFPDGVVFNGVARGGITFIDDHGFSYFLIGTNSNLYVGRGGQFTDQTPAGFIPGRIDGILGAGYGAGKYGAEKYGVRRTIGTLQVAAATWQFDPFGNEVVMVSSSDQTIWVWDPSTTPFVQKAVNSPTATAVMTTNEDFILAIGAGGVGRRIQWPDIGTTSVWTPTDINSAGDINLNTNGIGMAGTRVGLANLVWTTTDVHTVNFIGQPAIYAPVRIGTACGLIGPRAWAVAASGAGAGETAYWMSYGGFFSYSGSVIPLPCEVQDYLWNNINFSQASKIYASTNSRFNEVIWFFASNASKEIDSYVIYNYKDNIWYYGLQSLLARTTYLDRGVFPVPLAVDAKGIVYKHETGYLDDARSRVGHLFVESGPAEIGSGDQVIYANMMLVDGDGLVDDTGDNVLTVTPKSRQTPKGPLKQGAAIPFIPNSEGYTPVRFSGRQIGLRFDSVKDRAWEMGKFRLDVAAGGKR